MAKIRLRWLAWLAEVRECEHKIPKLIFGFCAALFSATMIRTFSWALATFGPSDALAVNLAEQVMSVSAQDFWIATGLASWGGLASLFHELRQDIQRLTVMNATGHMAIAQFAGIAGFLLAVYFTLPWTLGMVFCMSAGWGGNRTMVVINDVLMNRFFGPTEKKE